MAQTHRDGSLHAGFLLSQHAVQFYEDASCLVEVLDDFVREGLELGDAVVVMARSTHLAQLELRLSDAAAEVDAARATGQYVALDAADVLGKILHQGRPDEARFRREVIPLIDRGQARFLNVRVFGEMVAILWEQGRPEAAIELEALWNAVVKREGVALRCAYPLRLFDRAMHAEPFSRMCDQHAHVVPAESYPAPGNPDQRLRVVAELQQKARALEGEVLIRRQAEEALARQTSQLRAVQAELRQILKELQRIAENPSEATWPVARVISRAQRVQALVGDLLAGKHR